MQPAFVCSPINPVHSRTVATCSAAAPVCISTQRASTSSIAAARRHAFGSAVGINFVPETRMARQRDRDIASAGVPRASAAPPHADRTETDRANLERTFLIDLHENSFLDCYCLMSALQAPPPPVTYLQAPSGDPQSEFNLNAGKVVRTLREELPGFFEQGLRSFDIYSEELVFRDGNVAVQGLKVYKGMMWSLRMHGKMLYSNVQFIVRRMHQTTRDRINVRFTIQGEPRLPGQEPLLFEGCSVYKLNSKGLVCEHAIDNVITLGSGGYASPLQRMGLMQQQDAAFAAARVRISEIEDEIPRM